MSSTAPSQCTEPGARTGDSGMKKIAETIATSVTANGIQKSQW